MTYGEARVLYLCWRWDVTVSVVVGGSDGLMSSHERWKSPMKIIFFGFLH